ncbi:glycine receptor subunit alpha-4-like [Ptychodera flava]|uniref:glycine receptor subunit alpha-4-like n=1 Tax=Ptychodera flava TaxID=63121 RepID=UPI00396A5286
MVELHASPKKNSLMRIYQNGSIDYSVRLSLRSSCHMDLHNFPFDEQECSEKVSSYAYTIDDILVKWSESDIMVNEGVRLPQYILSEWVKNEGQESNHAANYSYVEMSFKLDRELGFYLLQVYIPSAALVIIAWLTLWIDASVSSPARASLGITTILALVTQSSWLRSEIPKVAYVTALDVWLATCQLLVFLILLQFTFIYYLNKLSGRREISGQTTRKRRYQEVDRHFALESNMESVDIPPDNVRPLTRRNGHTQQAVRGRDDSTYRRGLPKRRAIYSKLAHQTDKYSRIVFLVLFLTFNLFYWPTYTILRSPMHH